MKSWLPQGRRRVGQPYLVAQGSNLLYRRLAAGRALVKLETPEVPRGSRLEIGDTADWKSALP
jgi:hypothetical protein